MPSAPRLAVLPERRDHYRRPATGHAARAAEEARRRAELDRIRIDRRLTDDEQAEHDRLAQRLYMREWRRANYAGARA